jgi:hypothetical protein
MCGLLQGLHRTPLRSDFHACLSETFGNCVAAASRAGNRVRSVDRRLTVRTACDTMNVSRRRMDCVAPGRKLKKFPDKFPF